MQVLVRDKNIDQALRVLKKKMQREGVFREMKRRRFYEKPSEQAARPVPDPPPADTRAVLATLRRRLAATNEREKLVRRLEVLRGRRVKQRDGRTKIVREPS
jgi:small subunit ribosomal protein S21